MKLDKKLEERSEAMHEGRSDSSWCNGRKDVVPSEDL